MGTLITTKIDHIFRQNRQWAENERRLDPEFFSRLATQQSPEYLWIGCSDSRVPANDIIGMRPGEVFVHRNIANLVVHSDLNCLSVIQYAVDVLKVKHIIVCGHYGCGGVQAALANAKNGLIDNWLLHIRDLYRLHKGPIDKLSDDKQRADRLCELNVVAQTVNVAATSIVKDAWARGQELTIHALVYSISDGLLKDLKSSLSTPLE